MKKTAKKIVLLLVFVLLVSLMPTQALHAAPVKRYTISDETITPIVSSGEDISKNVNAALKEAYARSQQDQKIYTVKLPQGSYYISESMKIRSNTTLDATDCIIYANAGTFNMIATGNSEENKLATGYDTYNNITIIGGTWINSVQNKASGIRLCRGSNIELRDIDMSHGSEKHMLEMAAVKDVKITGCSFHDSDVKDSNAKCEAIQIDISANSGAFSSIIYDGTNCKNIIIDGNVFQNVSRGIGTHSMLLNSYHENITITNNQFIDITQEAIACVNYRDSMISNNNMQNVGGGILFHYSKTSNESIYTKINNGDTPYEGELITNAHSVIENNVIETRYHELCDKNVGIELYGRKIKESELGTDSGTIPAADYYVEGVTIQNNKITAAGYGINLNDAKNNTIRNNTIKGANYDSKDPLYNNYNGIRISNGSTGNIINNNVISNIRQTGIFIYDRSSAKTVNGNKVKNCSAFGIRLNNNCKVTQSMKKNHVSGCPEGIVANKKTKCYVKGGISNNKVKK